jgi:hypothetical protein
MNYEKEYINYLIENVKEIDNKILDDYFLNKIEFDEVIESIDATKFDVMSFNTFIKSKKIDDLFK